MPPWNWNTSPRSWSLSTMMIRRPAFRKASSRKRLVDRVVDDFVDQVVEAACVDRADVHRWPFSDRLQAFEDLDLRSVVGGLFYHLFRNLLERVSVPSRGPSRGTAQVYGRLL